MMYMVIKKVTIPYNKIAFEATNDHGVVDLEKWNDAVNFKKIEAKKEFFEAAIGGPGVILFVVGLILVGFFDNQSFSRLIGVSNLLSTIRLNGLWTLMSPDFRTKGRGFVGWAEGLVGAGDRRVLSDLQGSVIGLTKRL